MQMSSKRKRTGKKRTKEAKKQSLCSVAGCTKRQWDAWFGYCDDHKGYCEVRLSSGSHCGHPSLPIEERGIPGRPGHSYWAMCRVHPNAHLAEEADRQMVMKDLRKPWRDATTPGVAILRRLERTGVVPEDWNLADYEMYAMILNNVHEKWRPPVAAVPAGGSTSSSSSSSLSSLAAGVNEAKTARDTSEEPRPIAVAAPVSFLSAKERMDGLEAQINALSVRGERIAAAMASRFCTFAQAAKSACTCGKFDGEADKFVAQLADELATGGVVISPLPAATV